MKCFTFYHFDFDPRFPPFLLYVRWKSGVTFVRRCFHDVFVVVVFFCCFFVFLLFLVVCFLSSFLRIITRKIRKHIFSPLFVTWKWCSFDIVNTHTHIIEFVFIRQNVDSLRKILFAKFLFERGKFCQTSCVMSKTTLCKHKNQRRGSAT